MMTRLAHFLCLRGETRVYLSAFQKMCRLTETLTSKLILKIIKRELASQLISADVIDLRAYFINGHIYYKVRVMNVNIFKHTNMIYINNEII